MANINKIRVSGNTYNIEDLNAARTITLTQAEYDALQTKDPNVFYIISDSNINYITSAETQSAITQAVSGKADSSSVYLKSETSGATEISTALADKLDATAYTPTDLSNYYTTAQTDTKISQSVSGKTNQSDFTAHTANTTVHVTAQDKTNWNAKSDFSGSYNDLTDKPTIPTVPTSNTAFTNDAGYLVANDITGKTNQSDFTAHTANTTAHVTQSEKNTWNAKSDFSGSYNDLTNKPTIPTVPTSNTAFTNDAGYLVASDISGKQDVSGMTAYTTTATTSALNNVVTAHTANTTVHVTAQDKTNWNAKSDFSGSYNDLTDKPTIPTVPTSNTAFTNDAGYLVSNDISGKTNQSDFTGHTANTTVHITAAERTSWNAKSDFSGSYNDLTDKPTIPTVPTSNTAFTNDAGYITDSALDGYATESYVNTSLSNKQDTLESGVNIKTVNNYSLLGSGNINIGGSGSNNVVELTQAQYDALDPKDPSAFYIITDAEGGDLANYYTKTEVDNAITAATSTKQDTLTAGRGININASNVVSFNLPISAGTRSNSIVEGEFTIASGNYSHAEGYNTKASGDTSHAEGYNTTASGNSSHAEGEFTIANGYSSHAEGYNTTASGNTSHAEGNQTIANGYSSHAEGLNTRANNPSEHASGRYNNSVSASTTFGDSGNTLFSVGNGTADNARHNAFEIRQNGDIYLTLDGQDVKLQDQLGGGGTVDQTIISGSTNAVAGGAVYSKIDEVEQVTAAALNNINDRLSEDEEVTAAGLNAVNDKFGGLSLVKLTQAEYDAIATKDASTLYIIIN